MYAKINQIIEHITTLEIEEARKEKLNVLIEFILVKREQEEAINLNFICTHNSRRSQLAQVWADVASAYYDLNLGAFSGGVEITECNPRTIASLKRFGFEIETKGANNPKYQLRYSEQSTPIALFSKLYDDPVNPTENFAAIMTCGHADENCPLIVGCEKRISLTYEDPKEFDDTRQEAHMYDARSMQIASEMFYVFSRVNNVR